MSLFYFGYYRMLFEEFVSWPVFCFVQVVHFAMEWLVYCFRSSATFYEFICVADMSLPEAWRRHSNLTVFITKGLSHRDWQMFLSVELQLRLISLGISAPVSLQSMMKLLLNPLVKLFSDLKLFGISDCRPLLYFCLRRYGAGGCAVLLNQCLMTSTRVC